MREEWGNNIRISYEYHSIGAGTGHVNVYGRTPTGMKEQPEFKVHTITDIKIAQDNLKYATDFSDKILKGIPTSFGNEIDKFAKTIGGYSSVLENAMNKQAENLRKYLTGDETGRNRLEAYDKEKKDYYERSNPRTNEFVIKSQIEVTNKGFNMEPAVNVKGTPYIVLQNKK